MEVKNFKISGLFELFFVPLTINTYIEVNEICMSVYCIDTNVNKVFLYDSYNDENTITKEECDKFITKFCGEFDVK